MKLFIKTAFSIAILYFSIIAYPAGAENFIGQWHIFKDQKHTIGQTIDGLNKLQIKVSADQQVTIIFFLNNFAGFGTENEVFEYGSPTYGNIRTVDYYLKQNQIILRSPYEVNRFIENLKDIATHPMLLESNLGTSFKDRKISLSYLSQAQQNTLSNAAFSTIEIDEVLQALGVN